MRVMPHSHTLSARISMAWTISRPLGLRVGIHTYIHKDLYSAKII